MSNEALWYLSRATGIASILLLTFVAVLGAVTSGRRKPEGESATIVMGLHRWVSLGMIAFLAAHITTATVETYVAIDWISALIPFTSAYSTAWVGLGTLAVDLLLAVIVTSIFRHRIPERRWRLVHYISYAIWPIALVHGFALGTADQPYLRATTAACAAAGCAAIAWRLATQNTDRARRTTIATQEWS